jgi:V8-like Glu-specific endopeptidase
MATTRFVWMLSAAASAAACLDGYSPPQEHSEPVSFVDARGLRWELQREVTQFTAAEPKAPHDESADTEQPWAALSDQQLAQRFRPITLMPDNREYALSDASALQFARQLREAAATVPREAPASVHEASPLMAERTRRVLTEERFPTQTFGPDDRVNMNGSASETPWRYIAAMSNAGQCTAFKMLNAHTAVTAAHCVHDGTEWYRRKTLQFAAGASEPPFAALPGDCYSMTIPGGWDGEDASSDYAIIRLREEGLEGGAACDFASYDVGHFGYRVVDECAVDVPLNLAGYPSVKDPDHPAPTGDWQYPSLFSDHRKDGWTSCGLYPSALWFWNDGSNGQSGSPVWSFDERTAQNQVRAIYRGSVTNPVGESNRGRRFEESLISWLTLNAGY